MDKRLGSLVERDMYFLDPDYLTCLNCPLPDCILPEGGIVGSRSKYPGCLIWERKQQNVIHPEKCTKSNERN